MSCNFNLEFYICYLLSVVNKILIIAPHTYAGSVFTEPF